ncbi:MAG: YdeI/OmpD-associated family protein [Bacteroidales bacterium]|nr:YdeI/OmpD-associated family protein [Bacteroidales bacterium]
MENTSTNSPHTPAERWQKELVVLSSIIRKMPLEKTIKWGSEVFTWNGKNVVSYGGFKNYFALWFYNGVFLSDPNKVLINAQEGVTRSLRQWRFQSLEELDEVSISEYILEAIEVEKKGLKHKPERFKPLPMPQMLAEALSNDPGLQEAYGKLSPGKQKEYIQYLNEARQETTKHKRLEKIVPMIAAGMGLNDRYKKS